jgi:hypothetical protein
MNAGIQNRMQYFLQPLTMSMSCLSPGTSGTLPAIFVIFFMYKFLGRDPGKRVQSAGYAGAGFLAF